MSQGLAQSPSQLISNLLLGSLLIFLPILSLSDHSAFEGFLQILPFLALSLQYKRPRLNLDLEIVIAREPKQSRLFQ
jgi:hypothetical protein